MFYMKFSGLLWHCMSSGNWVHHK